MLVPAALEGQITAENAERLECGLVVEAANGPTTPEADEILARRAIQVIPDVLANAGGVTVSYFEWVQDQQKYSWSGEEIVERLRLQLQEAFARRGGGARAPRRGLAHGRPVGGDRPRGGGLAAAHHLPLARVHPSGGTVWPRWSRRLASIGVRPNDRGRWSPFRRAAHGAEAVGSDLQGSAVGGNCSVVGGCVVVQNRIGERLRRSVRGRGDRRLPGARERMDR